MTTKKFALKKRHQSKSLIKKHTIILANVNIFCLSYGRSNISNLNSFIETVFITNNFFRKPFHPHSIYRSRNNLYFVIELDIVINKSQFIKNHYIGSGPTGTPELQI